MNKKLLAIAALALVTSAPAMAAGGVSLRGAAYYGTYQYDEHGPFGETENGKTAGAGIGANVSMSRFFADLGLDYFDVNDGLSFDFVRTDMTLTTGVIATSWLSPYVGYRRAWQDTGKIFDDDVWTENGFYVGTGIGPFSMGSKLWLSTSVAYNVNEVTGPGGGDDEYYNGASVKLKLGLKNSPHAMEVRAQRFKGKNDGSGFDNGIAFTETYAYVGYVFTWRAATF